MLSEIRNGHTLVLWSSIVVLLTNAVEPLASGILTSRGSPVLVPSTSPRNSVVEISDG